MIKKAINNEKLPVYGNGLNVRDWIYVEDHCKIILELALKGSPGESYCIGMENELNNHINNNGINKLNYCTAIDQHWNILQGKDNFYVANPVLGTQRNSWSDNNCSIEFQTSKINEI